MLDQTTLEGKVITAAMDLAASPGWTEVSLRDIADAAGCPLGDVMEHFASKDDILKAFIKAVDRAMLANAGQIEREQSSRDAVFEVIMSRFDAMMPYKAGLKSIVKASAGSLPPAGMVCLALSSQNKILQAAGVNAAGMPALLRQLGLAQIYVQVFRIWLNDDDPGMARTMAALDRRLRQGEGTMHAIDDVARASERMCAQASDFAEKLFSMITPARRETPGDAPPATNDATPPPATGSASGGDAPDAAPGASPA